MTTSAASDRGACERPLVTSPSPHKLRWRYFPPTEPLPNHLRLVVDAFSSAWPWIQDYVGGKSGTDGRKVAAEVEQHFASNSGWHLEGINGKVRLPVIWGENGQVLARVEPDGVFDHGDGRVSLLEVEGGGAVQNNRLMKDLFEALLIPQVDYVAIAVPQAAHERPPYEVAVNLVAAIYARSLQSSHLKGVLLLGW